MSLACGHELEHAARRYLEDHGLEFVEGNYHCRRGELDLVMRDGDSLVFVEVRYRHDNAFGSGAESVNARKQSRLIATAAHWLYKHPDYSENPCRFDVISMTGSRAAPRVDWIRDAFMAH